ncbi:hypothetical protein EDB84DRAFT_1437920 [Lactarius hengduanensis]|nr:hypothetical protein EDB84DRAFT_1437920 [Lactarius hengduanensis]
MTITEGCKVKSTSSNLRHFYQPLARSDPSSVLDSIQDLATETPCDGDKYETIWRKGVKCCRAMNEGDGFPVARRPLSIATTAIEVDSPGKPYCLRYQPLRYLRSQQHHMDLEQCSGMEGWMLAWRDEALAKEGLRTGVGLKGACCRELKVEAAETERLVHGKCGGLHCAAGKRHHGV